MSTPKADARSFARWVALITAVGLVGRVAYVLFVTRHYTVWGDAYFYHESSNLIADGKGFINPIDWIENHVRIQAADHPPLYLIYLAGWSLIGVTSTTGHMLVSVLLGAATIAVTAYAGREIAGPRVGLIAAALVAHLPERVGTGRHVALGDDGDPHGRAHDAPRLPLLASPEPRESSVDGRGRRSRPRCHAPS